MFHKYYLVGGLRMGIEITHVRRVRIVIIFNCKFNFIFLLAQIKIIIRDLIRNVLIKRNSNKYEKNFSLSIFKIKEGNYA